MGAIFKIPGYIVYVIGGIWGLLLSVGIVYSKLGFLGIVASLIIFPITLYLAPWYAGFADGNWQPLIVTYGATVVAFVLIGIGTLIDKD